MVSHKPVEAEIQTEMSLAVNLIHWATNIFLEAATLKVVLINKHIPVSQVQQEAP